MRRGRKRRDGKEKWEIKQEENNCNEEEEVRITEMKINSNKSVQEICIGKGRDVSGNNEEIAPEIETKREKENWSREKVHTIQ